MVFVLELLTETALHEFVCLVEHCLVEKKATFGYFPGYCQRLRQCPPSVALLQLCEGWACLRFFTSWIETLLRHRTVQVETMW